MTDFDFFNTISDANNNSFAENARLHDKIIHAAVEAFQEGQGTGISADMSTKTGMHFSRLATVVEAIMYAYHPAAAETWFGNPCVGREG